MKGILNSWRNPPPLVRMAVVAGVFGALGLLGGLYADLLAGLLLSTVPADPSAAALGGAVAGVFFGAWFERYPPMVKSEDGAVRDSPEFDDHWRLDE